MEFRLINQSVTLGNKQDINLQLYDRHAENSKKTTSVKIKTCVLGLSNACFEGLICFRVQLKIVLTRRAIIY